MKSIKLSNNIEGLKKVLEKCYAEFVYDGSPSFEVFVPDVKEQMWFILKDDENPAGIITLQYINNVLWIPHVFIFPEYRKNNSEEWGKQVAEFMRTKCGTKRFLILTPYLAAKKYAERVGFTYIHTLPKSIMKNGELLDQYMLEM